MYLIPISMIGRELIMVLVMELLVNVGICQNRPALGKLTFTINDLFHSTTLQSVMNAKLSKHRFWHCHENGLIVMIQTIPHNL